MIQIRIRINTESLEWAAAALLMTGAAFSEIGPPELDELQADWGVRIRRTTRDGSSPPRNDSQT